MFAADRLLLPCGTVIAARVRQSVRPVRATAASSVEPALVI